MPKKRPKKRKYTCQKCGVALTGRATKWCDEHRPDRSNRKRVAAAHAAAGDLKRAKRVLEAGRAVAKITGEPLPDPTDEDLQPEVMQRIIMRSVWRALHRLERVVDDIHPSTLASTIKALFDGLDRMKTHQPIVGDVTYVHDESELE